MVEMAFALNNVSKRKDMNAELSKTSIDIDHLSAWLDAEQTIYPINKM